VRTPDKARLLARVGIAVQPAGIRRIGGTRGHAIALA